MSAPTLSQRPTPTRPTSPVRRTAPARPGPARGTTARTSASARPSARPGASGSGSTRSTSTRAASTPGASARAGSARGAESRAGSARAGVAAAVQGTSALALGLPERVGQAAGRARVRVVERPEVGSRRIGFAVTCSALLGTLMLGLLLLNVAISGNAFTVADLQSQRSLLVDQQQSLEQQLLLQNSPASLAARARALGMVPAAQVLVLAPDGTGAAPAPPAP